MLARDLGRENVADFAASSLDVKSRRITKLSALSKTKIDSDDNEDSHASAEAVESKKERVSAASSVSDTCPIGERIGGRYDFGLLVAGNECGSEDCNG